MGDDRMSIQKKLTLTAMNKLDQKYNEKKPILLLNQYQHTVHTHFRRSDIQKLLIDYFNVLQELKEYEELDSDILIKASSLLNVLVIKYFSDIELPRLDHIEAMIRASMILLDLGVMDQLFSDLGFPKDQLELLSNEINKASVKMEEQLGEMTERSESIG